MYLFNLPILAILALAILLEEGVLGLLPASPMPESVTNGEEGVRFLWHNVQNGRFHKWIPNYPNTQEAWWDFMHQDAEPLILAYYKDHPGSGFLKFIDLARTQNSGFYDYRDQLPKKMGEILVKAFADQRLAERKPRLEEEEVQSALRTSERVSELQEWGRGLSLRRGQTQASLDGRPASSER